MATDVARGRHHETSHRFVSRGSWSPDDLARSCSRSYWLAAERAANSRGDRRHPCSKKGLHVFGIDSRLEDVRSAKRFRVCCGHAWVLASIIARAPFSTRPWGLPVFQAVSQRIGNKTNSLAKDCPTRRPSSVARCRMSWSPGADRPISPGRRFRLLQHGDSETVSHVTLFGGTRSGGEWRSVWQANRRSNTTFAG